MATLKDIMDNRDAELKSLGEGTPGKRGSVDTENEKKKKEAVKRARDVDNPERTRVDGRKYRPSDIDKKTGKLRGE